MSDDPSISPPQSAVGGGTVSRPAADVKPKLESPTPPKQESGDEHGASLVPPDDQPRELNEPEFRAKAEDFVLWAVIAAVLAYLAWYLATSTAALSETSDVERLAVYGLNVRANMTLLVGGALTLLGCMIILRRVRVSFSATAERETLRARFIADSAGIVVVLLGVVLLGIVITHPPRVEGTQDTAAFRFQGERRSPDDLGERIRILREQQKNDPAITTPAANNGEGDR